MRAETKIIILLVLVVVFGSCDRVVVGMRMRRFLSQPVEFPSSLVCVEGTGESHVDLSETIIKFVVYIDSSRCSICSLNKLNRYAEYAALSKSNSEFVVAILLWPDSDIRASVEKDIEHRDYPFDVFIDYKGDFSKLNPNLPRRDSRFHCFLLDINNTPVLVGDPSISDQINSLFRERYNASFNKG